MHEEDPVQLGPYAIVRRLGQGGAACTYLGLAQGASGFVRRVALKTLRPERRGDGDLERLLIEEARLGGRLHHKNVVAVEDLGFDQGSYYLRMEFVDGADLGQLSSRVRPSPALALLIAAEVAEGLAYLHGLRDEEGRPLGLVHRDISPENILVSRAGEVKLADMGIAKARFLSDITWGKLRKGKYAYMSPEQIRGERLVGASDLFALGVVLAELLRGRAPFAGETPLLLMEAIKEAAPDLRGVPRGLRPLVSRCLQKAPGSRYADAEALLRALERERRAHWAGSRELAAWVSAALA